mmetsp:Transcript_69716/g.164007  ORF Transcript_69716/g.164007 Transcript_69716/m.164007 type:complete len:92 (-) Transcript_69716:141-416(-)
MSSDGLLAAAGYRVSQPESVSQRDVFTPPATGGVDILANAAAAAGFRVLSPGAYTGVPSEERLEDRSAPLGSEAEALAQAEAAFLSRLGLS